MSERTAPALATLDALLPALRSLTTGPDQPELIAETEALRRAVSAFHMEAIRFRMHSVDRRLAARADAGEARALFETLRGQLESAGFHTRSHAAPERPTTDHH